MSFENVVLTYPQPHVVVYVEDNTTYTETFLTAEEPVKMIQCGAFAAGRDNQLIYCEDYEQFENEFGAPDYKKYGQAAYNVARALKTGYAAAYVMRVMPDDACMANLIVSVKYKVITVPEIIDGEEVQVNKLSIGFKTSYAQNATSLEELQMSFNALKNYEPDDEGYITQPWFVAYQTGRGTYGNATRIRISDDTAYDDPDNTYKNYRFDVLQMQKTLKRLESAYGSLNSSLYDASTKESLYLEDLINDVEQGFAKVNINFNEALYEELVELYNDEIITDDAEQVSTSTLDIIFGRDMQGISNNKIVYTDDTVYISDSEGLSLYGGSEGSFDMSNDDRDQAITNCLIKAYSGGYDKMINSRYSTPADFMLDANFDADVKKAMVGLALKRKYDAMCYIDSGLLDTVESCIAWLEEFRDIYGYNVCKTIQHYKVRDVDYTGKTIDMTTTYHLAGLIPRHFKTKGVGEPMAMENAMVTEAVKGSFLPVIDPDEDDIKKEIYLLRGNYYETVRYNVYQRGVAINTQRETSDRMDEFNEYILHLAVSKATSILRSKLYKLAEEEDRNSYTETANKELQYILGPLVRSVTVAFKMSADDERKSILRLALRIVYKTVAKRGIVEIYLDPRA